MKSVFKNVNVKFFCSEILMLLINMFVYQICCLKLDKEISAYLALAIALVSDYFLCTKYVFKGILRENHYRFIQFGIIGIFSFFLKHLVIDRLYRSLIFSLMVARLFGTCIIMLFNYLFKYFIFFETYELVLKKLNRIYHFILKNWEQFISTKYIRFVFKFLPHNLFVFIFFIGSLYYTCTFFRDNDDLSLYNRTIADGYVKLLDNTVNVDFSDIQVDNDVDTVCLVFGTYGRENDSTLFFELYNEVDKKIYDYKINTKSLVDGGGLCLNVPLIEKEKLDQYLLKVIPKNATDENHVVMFVNKKTLIPALYLKKSHVLFSIKYFVIVIYLLIFFCINYLIQKWNNNASELHFLKILFIYLFSIMVIYPPLENPDEPVHFYLSYNLSQNGFDADKKTTINTPENIECLNYANIQYLDRVNNFDKVHSCLKDNNNKETNIMFGVSSNVSGSFLGHVPQAISIKLVDIFSNSSLLIFYVGRLGNLLFSFIILYFAIKITPVYKKILLFIGVMPMFIQQMTSLSYDAILNSVALLFIAYIIKHLYESVKIRKRDFFIPILFAIVMLTVKVVYFPLLILIFFIPKDKFQSKKQRIIYYASIFGVTFLINYIIQNILFVTSGGIVDERFSKQLNYILSNPFDIFKIAYNTIRINGWFYLRQLVGYFSWFRFSLSDFSVLGWLIAFVCLIFSEKNVIWKKKSKISVKKVILAFIILISIAGIFASMYLTWSNYKLHYVDGVQGRYFIPLLGTIALLFIPRMKKIEFEKKDLFLFINIMIIQYIVYTITYFY